ncbi:hypothetical protein AB4156_44225, partial [Cupriavidus sp. 2MCAB6]|uniref:hypothetical protein n=1 Tax=Cupriavidus sp. 2MCAB6 TaxID=3232981 RepID=UPI003F922421
MIIGMVSHDPGKLRSPGQIGVEWSCLAPQQNQDAHSSVASKDIALMPESCTLSRPIFHTQTENGTPSTE